MRKELFEKRGQINREIEVLNKMRYHTKKDETELYKRIEKLKKQYRFINNLLKVTK